MGYTETFTITDSTPAEAGTAIGSVVHGLARFHSITIYADLEGATDGTLDVYLQNEIAPGVWRDWVHFGQIAADAQAVSVVASAGFPLEGGIPTSMSEVGTGDAGSATPALAAESIVGGHPGNSVRAVYVAGEGTTAGADVTIRFLCWARTV